MKPWYDDMEGMTARAVTLAGLCEIADARHAAFYDRDERLDEWCVLGRYLLDTCGNFSLITEGAPAAAYSRVPAVMPVSDIYEHYVRSITSTAFWLPPAHIRCPACDRRDTRRWSVAENGSFTIADAHFAKQVYREENEPAWIGKTIAEINAFYRTNSPYTVCHISGVTNRNGWRECWNFAEVQKRNPKAMLDANNHIDCHEKISEGYVAHIIVYEWYHSACLMEKRRVEEQRSFAQAFAKAFDGSHNFEWEPIRNEYWSDADALPWYSVKTSIGTIKVGWRKRVIVLDWSDTNAKPDFSADNVTQGDSYVHAYGYDKLTEYLRRIKDSL